jgi:hypothetical protein
VTPPRPALAAAGAVLARLALAGVRAPVRADLLQRTNFRGRTVTLAAGPALTISASTAAALGATGPAQAGAALVAGLGSGAVGLYDDLVGDRPGHRAKGFRGHLRALRAGQVTSGLVKVLGVGAAGLAAAALLPATPRPGRARSSARPPAITTGPAASGGRAGVGTGRAHRLVEVVLGAGLIAGTANLVNLLDLRPGRALKAGLLLGAPLATGRHGGLAAGPAGAAAALLPADLAEDVMLGDAGANALGALLGVALTARTGVAGRAVLLTAVAALTAASERVSFTAVIERTPVLRELDALGRRPR